MKLKLFLFVLLTATVSFAQTDPVPSNQTETALKSIESFLTESEQKGFIGAVLISKNGKILLHKGYGFSDCKGKRKITPEMFFDIGSITKNITAFAIFKLQEQGKLKITDSISKYLKDVPPDKSKITIEQLVQHTAGMPDIFGADEDYVSKDWFLKKAFSEPLISIPGEKREYSNAGFSLLGAIIEEVTGQGYEEYVRKNVLDPADIKQTGYFLPKWKKQNVVCGILEEKRWGSTKDYFGKKEPSWHLLANGGMLSTIDELDKWFRAVLAYKIVSKETTDAWLDKAGRKTSRNTRYVASSGSNNIFSSLYVRWIDDDASLVLFTANGKWQKEQIQKQLLEEMNKIVTAKE